MGIQNLLRFMKPFIYPIHIKKYSGKRVGIDAYSWLHKGAYSCSMELCLNSRSKASSRYLQYFMHRINLLRHYKVIPVVVFDGGNIPCKSGTEDERQKKRDANLASAKMKLDLGDTSAAIEFFQKAVCITPSMAHQLIQILRVEGVEFVVAPYEADAQLAYLSMLEEEKGGIDAVITEDSDLMAYGCKAIIFKMDRNGNGEEILLDEVFNSVSNGVSFKNFDNELFTGMCVLAGCDFLPSVPGIGIKRAYSSVSKYKNLDRVLSVMKFEKGHQMPEEYLQSFREAVAVFHHARIYDTDTKSVKPMKPLPLKLLQTIDRDLDFLGPEIPSSIAAAIAEGHIDPVTMEAFDHFLETESFLSSSNRNDFDQFPKANSQVTSQQENCFTIYSAHQTRVENITVPQTVMENPTLDSRNYTNEADALKKLFTPAEHSQKLVVINTERPDFPDNNPFKKRKSAFVDMDQESNIEQMPLSCISTEESSNLANRKYSKDVVSFAALSSTSELNKRLEVEEIQRDFVDNSPFHRTTEQDLGDSGSTKSMPEQVSAVTDLEKPDVLCETPESQASVNCNPTKKMVSGRRKYEKKVKSTSKIKSSESTKTEGSQHDDLMLESEE